MNRQRGLTITELMVSLGIGLALMAVATYILLAGRQGYRTQDDVARLEENARFALFAISREIRLAGYAPANLSKFSEAPAILCDAPGGPSRSGPSRPAVAGCNDRSFSVPPEGRTLLTDEITVSFYGSGDGSGDGSITDCEGNKLAAGSPPMPVSDTFYIDYDSASKEPALFCTGQSGTRVMLASGVEAFQVLYGENTDENEPPDRFQPAGVVDMANVVSVKVALLLRTPGNGATGKDSRVYNLFGDSYAPGNAAPLGDAGSVFTAPGDLRARRFFTTTVSLRNRLRSQ